MSPMAATLNDEEACREQDRPHGESLVSSFWQQGVICRLLEKQDKVYEILLGSEAFQMYSGFFLVGYPILFLLFMVMYASCLTDALKESYKWQVWVPNAYLGFLLFVLVAGGASNKIKVFVRYMSFLFYLGIYQQIYYVYDNLLHFPEVFRIVVDTIDDISLEFHTQYFWIVIGIIVAVSTVISVFALGAAGILAGIPIIMLTFILMSIVFALMLLMTFSLYFYQVVVFVVCPYWTIYDTVQSVRRVFLLLKE